MRVVALKTIEEYESGKLKLSDETDYEKIEELLATTWETSDENIRCSFKGQTGFTEAKTKGAGQTTITKYMRRKGSDHKMWRVHVAPVPAV